MNRRLLLYRFASWIAATAALRLAGQHLLRPHDRSGALVGVTVRTR